jgi:hypothetical protein
MTPTVLVLDLPGPALMEAYTAFGVSHLLLGGLLLFALLVWSRARLPATDPLINTTLAMKA